MNKVTRIDFVNTLNNHRDANDYIMDDRFFSALPISLSFDDLQNFAIPASQKIKMLLLGGFLSKAEMGPFAIIVATQILAVNLLQFDAKGEKIDLPDIHEVIQQSSAGVASTIIDVTKRSSFVSYIQKKTNAMAAKGILNMISPDEILDTCHRLSVIVEAYFDMPNNAFYEKVMNAVIKEISEVTI